MTTPRPSRATAYGFPRQGPHRELKSAVESYWAGRIDAPGLLDAAAAVRAGRLQTARSAGLGEIPSNDFSLYDHVLDTAVMVGAIPARHQAAVPDVSTAAGKLDRYFAMARGTASIEPLEMTKWFDTNYHYLVPELGPETEFTLDPAKPLAEFAEALALGVTTRPVLVGPVTFLALAKASHDAPDEFDPLSLVDRLLPLYADLLGRLREAGADWVQLDEPVLVLDQPQEVLDVVARVYAALTSAPHRPKLLVATYFDQVGDALGVLRESAVEGVGLDFTGPAAANLEALEGAGGLPGKRLVAGVVSGRNIWAADLSAALDTLQRLAPLADQVDVAPASSLLHVPIDAALETDLDPQVTSWLAFAQQKVQEVVTLATGLSSGRDAIADQLREASERLASRAASPLVRDDAVRARAAAVTDADTRRALPYEQRHDVQAQRLGLPRLPTTTIGSFPQTSALRQARAGLRRGQISAAEYDEAMRTEIVDVVSLQEELGLDVLVHGEPERNDMVQYFAEQLDGFLVTGHGWVQSYGSRYVRPPVILGDVARPEPMTVPWSGYAQRLTDKPVKGMLTGPVTMLAWSFVRDDQPEAETARQVALALRDEVADLEAAGIAIIQVDEPALRETLPLRGADRAAYLDWAVDAFKLTTCGTSPGTQVHTHMCYAEFDDILAAIVAMDADVISLEAARSRMEVLDGLAAVGYPNEVGPGVWDIHSPRVPSSDEIIDRLRLAVEALPAQRLWVNPDCGLKTRGYPEVEATLANLVQAARVVRAEVEQG